MEARLCFVGHVLMENRSGLVVDAELTRASGHAERLAALAMLDRLPTTSPATLGTWVLARVKALWAGETLREHGEPGVHQEHDVHDRLARKRAQFCKWTNDQEPADISVALFRDNRHRDRGGERGLVAASLTCRRRALNGRCPEGRGHGR
jgi:hypothetical protein